MSYKKYKEPNPWLSFEIEELVTERERYPEILSQGDLLERYREVTLSIYRIVRDLENLKEDVDPFYKRPDILETERRIPHDNKYSVPDNIPHAILLPKYRGARQDFLDALDEMGTLDEKLDKSKKRSRRVTFYPSAEDYKKMLNDDSYVPSDESYSASGDEDRHSRD